MFGSKSLIRLFCLSVVTFALFGATSQTGKAQQNNGLTPAQREIEKQRALLSSSEIETRRDALIRLGNLKRAESSRVAAGSLTDAAEVVRANAAHAVLSLPAKEAVAALTPLLNDKSEFVRQQVAYALGETKSDRAVQALVSALASDKQDSVRGAAAVALGEIGDQTATLSLAAILDPGLVPTGAGKKQKSKRKKENEFVARAAAHSLGQIGSRHGLTALEKALSDQTSPADLRREAAAAMGKIGDPAAEPALRSVLGDEDPHLGRIAQEALREIQRNRGKQGT